MKSLRNNILQIGLYITFSIAGYLYAKFCKLGIPYFVVDKSIDITNISTLIISVWLTIIITTIFDKQKNDYRIEKDLIIKRVDSIYEIANNLQLESNSGKIHISEASSSIKRINTSLQSVYSIVDKCKFTISSEIQAKIKACISDLRNILTNTPSIEVTSSSYESLPIEIKDSMIYYNRDRLSQIEVKFDLLKNLLLELQIDINKK